MAYLFVKRHIDYAISLILFDIMTKIYYKELLITIYHITESGGTFYILVLDIQCIFIIII